jgi:peptide/nickel transport system permease protein
VTRAARRPAFRAGAVLLSAVVAGALGAPWLSPNAPDERFRDLLYAPPTGVHVSGGLHIYPLEVVSRIERRFEEDRSRPVPLRWFSGGRLVTADAEAGAPLLLLGADGYGRDILARLLHGARLTLLLAVVATIGATALGTLVGGVSGQAGGWIDTALSRTSEFVLVLPAIYVALALRAALPLVLPAASVFALLAAILTFLGWPIVARGVRAIVLAERGREYAEAARAAGAGPIRLLARHLLPAAAGYVTTQATLLFPAFILAEATLSFVGLGFPDTVATWGTMLREASNVAALADTPWTLTPAAAIFLVVLGINLVVQGSGRTPVQLER